jgi:hypothetical protein
VNGLLTATNKQHNWPNTKMRTRSFSIFATFGAKDGANDTGDRT